jgi:Family of unknown function (DUF5681)
MSQDQIDNRERPAHLFKPGQSGNPGGRPKGLSLTAQIRAALQESAMGADGKPLDGYTRGRKIVDELVKLAESGDLDAARLILAYVDGRPGPVDQGPDDAGARQALLSMAVELTRERLRQRSLDHTGGHSGDPVEPQG